MDFMKIMDLMNYNFESQGAELYSICNNFIKANMDILSSEHLETVKESLLPPSAFDDERNRSNEKYVNVVNEIDMMINMKKGKGMVA